MKYIKDALNNYKFFILNIFVLTCICLGICNTRLYDKITHCVVKSNLYLNSITSRTRGNNYFLTINDNTCFITTWHIIHLLQYIYLGFFFPSYYVILIVLGILFEVVEKYFIGCEDLLDIVFNISGLFIGICIHRVYINK